MSMKKMPRKITRGSIKSKLYLEEVLTTEEGLKMLRSLRKKHHVPRTGYKPPKPFFHVDQLNLPKCWLSKENMTRRAHALDQLVRDMMKIAHHFNILLEYSIPSYFLDYVFYNRYGNTNKKTDANLAYLDDASMNLCHWSDMFEVHAERMNVPREERDCRDQNLSIFYKQFPVALHISPYAKIRDIRDYLQQNSETIQALQNKYKNESSSLGKLRKRDSFKKKRNALVWKFRNKPRADFVNAFCIMFPNRKDDCPDIGAFNTIKGREKRRRMGRH